jgi:cysteine dioxygenase
MNDIKTIKEFAEILDEIEPHQRAKTMKRINIQAAELATYATWAEGCYTRNCLARTEKYELILLCWEINAQAPIHGHGGEDCWVYQVQGTVEEVRFQQEGEALIETNRMTLSPGKLTYMNDRMGYHSIGNISNQRALTLHIYASPIHSCKVYNNQKDCFEIKEMSYHTFKGSKSISSFSPS